MINWMEVRFSSFSNLQFEFANPHSQIKRDLGLTIADQPLITNGTGNNGDALDNAFNLNWEMGSMNGGMNANSMFEQVADGTIGSLGTYTTIITLTLTTL